MPANGPARPAPLRGRFSAAEMGRHPQPVPLPPPPPPADRPAAGTSRVLVPASRLVHERAGGRQTSYVPAARREGRPMREAVIVDAVRTPLGRGKQTGGLFPVHAVDLAARPLRALV